MARGRIEGQQLRPGGQQDPRRQLAITRPIGDTARRRPHARRHRVPPHLFAGVGLEREHLIASRREIHHAGDHDRRDLRIAARRLGAFSGDRARRSRAASLWGRRTCGTSTTTARRTFSAVSARASTTTTCRRLRQAYRPGLRERAHIVGVDVGQR